MVRKSICGKNTSKATTAQTIQWREPNAYILSLSTVDKIGFVNIEITKSLVLCLDGPHGTKEEILLLLSKPTWRIVIIQRFSNHGLGTNVMSNISLR